MKTNKAVRMGINLVGVEINTIQDVVKAQAAGLELVDKDGWGYDYTTDDEETGEEVDPTEKEIFDRISKDIADGKEVCLYDPLKRLVRAEKCQDELAM